MIKKLLKSVREYKKVSILTPVFTTLEVVMETLIPMVMAYLIDYGIDDGNMSNILKYGLILVICAMISLLFGILGGKFGAAASAGFARNLRQDMYFNVQDFSFTNIDKFSTASIITRLTTDTTNVQNAYQMILRMAVRAPIMMICSLVMAFSINKSLSLIFLCAMPFLALGLYLILTRVHPIFQRVFRKYDVLNNVVQEDLRGIRVVKSFVREDYEISKFEKISGEIQDEFIKGEKILAFNMPLMQFVMYVCTLLVSWFGARLIVASGGDPQVGMSTGQLMSLISYQMQILMSLMILSMIFMMIVMSRASAERIVEILDEKSDIANPQKPVYAVQDGSVSFEQVIFGYGKNVERPALKNVNLTIQSGETIGIIGGTGSAKSSLVQLLPRLYDVTSGSVKVGGVDVRDYDLETLRKSVAMVLQKNEIFSGTIKENLRWGNENATDDELVHACQLAQADEFIRAMPDGYDTHVEQGGTNVSGGQKQRLCIARALLKNPKILILDDSTSAVDTHTDALIRQAFHEEIPNVTKLIIAQRISSIEDADKVIVMENGEVNGFDTPAELMKTNKIYQEVYASQMKGAKI